jgi:guanylate kinase
MEDGTVCHKQKGLLLVISGPSGVGKGTICEQLIEKNENITYSVSVTTRQKRPGEIDGQHYYFATEEEFSNMVQQDAFLEYTRVFSEHSYGTPKKYVTEQMEKGKDVILEIDVQGGLQIKNAFPDAVLVFIAPPDMNELQKRLIRRGTESETAIRLRTETAYMEMQCVSYYDYLVVNSDVEAAMLDIKSIISSEKSKVSRNDDFLDILLGGFAYHDELSGRE